MRWRVEGDWRGTYGTYERALRRARELSRVVRADRAVEELDEDGNPTPVAVVKYKERKNDQAQTR